MESSLPSHNSRPVNYHTRLEIVLLTLFFLFLLVFPKGGIKIGKIPITWGYILIALTGFVFFFISLARGLETSRQRWLAILAAMPFQCYLILVFLANGYLNFGFAMSMIIGFVALPWIFVFFLGNYLDDFHPRYLLNLIRHGIFWVAVYGIVLFFYRALTGEWLEIPFLTINYGDIGALDTKFNVRFGFLPKLIATYNNGNIYGVSILMFLPLFDRLEKSRWKSAIVKLSLILTLSRTVWMGLLFYELFVQLYLNRFSVKRLWQSALLLTGVVVSIVIIAFFVLGGGAAFLFDPNLGGRAKQLALLDNLAIVTHLPLISIAEMVYLSVLERLGILGLVLYLLMMATPLFINLGSKAPLKRAFIAGVGMYLFVSLSDGASSFIPVLAFFWFMASLAVSRDPYFDRPDVPDFTSRATAPVGVKIDVKRPERRLNIFDLAGFILRHKKIVGTAVMAAVAVMTVIMLIIPGQYVSRASILPSENPETLQNYRYFSWLGILYKPFDESSSMMFPSILRSERIRDSLVLAEYRFEHDGKEMVLKPSEYLGTDNPDELKNKFESIFKIEYDWHGDGVIYLVAATRYPGFSQALLNRALAELEKFNNQKQQTKGRFRLDFLNRELMSAKAESDLAESRLIAFQAANRDWENSTDASLLRELGRRERQAKAARRTWEWLFGEYQMAQMKTLRDTPTLKILDRPTLPESALFPRKIFSIFIFGIAAFLGTIWALLALETFRDTTGRSVREFWTEFKENIRSETPAGV